MLWHYDFLLVLFFFPWQNSTSNKKPHCFQCLYNDVLLKNKSKNTFILDQALTSYCPETSEYRSFIHTENTTLHLCQVGKYSSRAVILAWFSPVCMEQISVSVWHPVERLSGWVCDGLMRSRFHITNTLYGNTGKPLALITLALQDILWKNSLMFALSDVFWHKINRNQSLLVHE